MSEITSNERKVKDDEIDLLDLLRRMGKTMNRWSKALGRAFLISVVFLLKRWVPLGLSIIAGFGVSYFFRSTSTSSFTSDLVVRNNLALIEKRKIRDNSGTTSEIISKINKLQSLCSGNDPVNLAEALSMNFKSVKNISDISAYWIIDQGKDGIPDFVDYKGNHSAYDTINIRMQDRLDVRVKTNSPQALNLVRDGIIKFVEKDSLFQKRNRTRLRQNEDLMSRLNFDIRQLDSLQKVKYFEETRNIKPTSGGQIVFLQEQKTQLLYGDIQSLYSRKQELESERDLYKGVLTVLSDFSAPTRRENGTMYYVKYIVPLFFCATLLLLILWANRIRLKEIYNKY
jgi:hypothetical protein